MKQTHEKETLESLNLL